MNKLALLLALLMPSVALSGYTQDVHCLADTLYHEARGEPLEGRTAVGYSVINRVKDRRWPSTICDVVYQPHQYAWVYEKHPINNQKAYKESTELAKSILDNKGKNIGANHYLRCDARPKIKTKWWKKMTFLGQIGNHCFYKG